METIDIKDSFLQQLQMQLESLQQKLIKAQQDAIEYLRQIDAVQEQINSGNA